MNVECCPRPIGIRTVNMTIPGTRTLTFVRPQFEILDGSIRRRGRPARINGRSCARFALQAMARIVKRESGSRMTLGPPDDS